MSKDEGRADGGQFLVNVCVPAEQTVCKFGRTVYLGAVQLLGRPSGENTPETTNILKAGDRKDGSRKATQTGERRHRWAKMTN